MTTLDRSSSDTAVDASGPADRHIPALDGLRAVAVLAVMVYHSGAAWLPGGFLGVDLFFVLSGFLITSLLLAEYRRWGSIDLLAFWGRRVRRLMPALVLVVIVTLLLVLALGNVRGAANGRDALASLLYVNNWNQVANETNYFDTFFGASPFVHTWSLAIEEQFYLVWPPVLAWFLASRGGRLRGLAPLVVAVAIASAAIMVSRYSESNPTPAYVSTDARLQTIALGALVAIVMAGDRGPRIAAALRAHRARSTALGVVLLLGVLASFALLADTASALFHGGLLAVAALCAALLLVVAHGPSTPLTRGLGVRPLVLVGLISYGLYLWHWPVFTLLDGQRLGLAGPPLVLAQWTITFAAASLSYVLVERPIRTRWVRDRWGVVAERWTLILGILAAVGLSLLVWTTSSATMAERGAGNGTVGTGVTSVYLFGDSVSFGLRRDFDSLAHPEFKVSGTSQLGCPAFPVTNMIGGEEDPPKDFCLGWFDSWRDNLAAVSPDIAVLPASQWLLFDIVVDGRTVAFGSPAWKEALTAQYDDHVETMRAHSGTVVLMNQPCYRVYDDGSDPRPATINDDSRVATYNAFLDDYAASKGLKVLDIHDWLCGPGRNPELIDGVKTRVEGLHFTYEGAQLVWNWLTPQLRELTEAGKDASATS